MGDIGVYWRDSRAEQDRKARTLERIGVDCPRCGERVFPNQLGKPQHNGGCKWCLGEVRDA